MIPQLNRLAIIFALLLLAYFVLRWVATPDSFYWYGHYRGKALNEAAAKPIVYAEKRVCLDCHDDQWEENQAGPHASISCQSCHGPGEMHLDDPMPENINRPDPHELCVLCHKQNSARPSSFPQIEVMDHSGGELCTDCHVTHNPGEFQ